MTHKQCILIHTENNCVMDSKTKIGLRMKELRTENELTHEAIAFKPKIDRTFMNHVENWKRKCIKETLEKLLCHGLKTNFKIFFNFELFNG